MKEQDILDLVEEFLNLPEEDWPAAVEAIQTLEKHKIIDPPISQYLMLN